MIISLKNKKYIISVDNYSSGTKKNHIKNKRVRYINCKTDQIATKLNSKKKKDTFNFSFFGEFARIYQSF